MDQQQWKPVVFRKKVSNKGKGTHVHNPTAHRLGKVNDDTGTFSATKKKGGHAFRTKMQAERLKAKLSQKELAQKLNVSEATIKQYESGHVIPNNGVIARIERCMNTKLPRIT